MKINILEALQWAWKLQQLVTSVLEGDGLASVTFPVRIKHDGKKVTVRITATAQAEQ